MDNEKNMWKQIRMSEMIVTCRIVNNKELLSTLKSNLKGEKN